MTLKQKGGAVLLVMIFFILCVFALRECQEEMSKNRSDQCDSTVWLKTSVKVNYQPDSDINSVTSDTFEVVVYEYSDNFSLENGCLSYWKYTPDKGYIISQKTSIACYVRSYQILKSDRKSKCD